MKRRHVRSGRYVAFLNSTFASTGRPALVFTDTAYFLCRHVQVALPGKVIRAELILDQRRVRSIGRNSPYCCAHHIPIGVTSTKTSDQVASMFAASCGSFRDMRLAGAFFANRAEIVDDMLNVEGGFWASTTVPAQSAGFQCSCVALCDTRRRDIGTDHRLHIDAAGKYRAALGAGLVDELPAPQRDEVHGAEPNSPAHRARRRATRLQLPAGRKPRAIRHPVGRRRQVTSRRADPGKRSLTTPQPLGFAETNRS